jgi:hypothetical protein
MKPKTRVLIFNFFGGLMDRGIPLSFGARGCFDARRARCGTSCS